MSWTKVKQRSLCASVLMLLIARREESRKIIHFARTKCGASRLDTKKCADDLMGVTRARWIVLHGDEDLHYVGSDPVEISMPADHFMTCEWSDSFDAVQTARQETSIVNLKAKADCLFLKSALYNSMHWGVGQSIILLLNYARAGCVWKRVVILFVIIIFSINLKKCI